jgi:hypothetical protein
MSRQGGGITADVITADGIAIITGDIDRPQ